MKPWLRWGTLASIIGASIACATADDGAPEIDVLVQAVSSASASATGSPLAWCISQPAAWPSTDAQIADALGNSSATVRNCAIERLSDRICDGPPAAVANLEQFLQWLSVNGNQTATTSANTLLQLYLDDPKRASKSRRSSATSARARSGRCR